MPTHDIFLSYSNKDRPRIIPIVKRLQAEGWKVWWDTNIRTGDRFHKIIEKNLNDSKCVVVCWSSYSIESDWVLDEAEEGKQRGVLFPMIIDNVKKPYGFGRIHTANLIDFKPGQSHQEFEKFIKSIHSRLGTKSGKPNLQASISTEYPVKDKIKLFKATPHIIKGTNTFTDPRDGQTYKTVKLKDGNIWMAQNLNFDVGQDCWFNNDAPKNGKKYGRLYTWDAAKKACPTGCHLPSDEEWRIMIDMYGGLGIESYQKLIYGGNSGFSALLGSTRGLDGSFYGLDSFSYYWSSTEFDSDSALQRYFLKQSSKLGRYSSNKSWGFSCRCIQD